jgi:hypothetical protein
MAAGKNLLATEIFPTATVLLLARLGYKKASDHGVAGHHSRARAEVPLSFLRVPSPCARHDDDSQRRLGRNCRRDTERS